MAREKWHQRTSMQRTMFDTFAYVLHVLSMVIISSQMFPGGVSLRSIFHKLCSDWLFGRPIGFEHYLKISFRDPTKYLADYNFRNQLNLDDVSTTEDVWETLGMVSYWCLLPTNQTKTLKHRSETSLSEKTVINIIHGPSHYSNGWQKKPEIMTDYAKDLVNYRIGPARLTQFRHQARIFSQNYKIWNHTSSVTLEHP